jgi:hypothetical protein
VGCLKELFYPLASGFELVLHPLKGGALTEETELSRNELDNMEARAKELGAKGLAWVVITSEGVKSPIAKFFSEHEIDSIIKEMSDIFRALCSAAFDEKDFAHVETYADKVSNMEKDADVARRKTAALLYEGAFLPVMRSRLYDLSGRIDNVADTMKNVANMLHYLREGDGVDTAAMRAWGSRWLSSRAGGTITSGRGAPGFPM